MLARPPRGAEILRRVRDSGASILAIDDADLWTALRGLAHQGIYVEPTSAVAPAAVARTASDRAPSARASRSSSRSPAAASRPATESARGCSRRDVSAATSERPGSYAVLRLPLYRRYLAAAIRLQRRDVDVPDRPGLDRPRADRLGGLGLGAADLPDHGVAAVLAAGRGPRGPLRPAPAHARRADLRRPLDGHGRARDRGRRDDAADRDGADLRARHLATRSTTCRAWCSSAAWSSRA